MSKIVRRRKGGIRISLKGKIGNSPGGVRIGGRSGGVNRSRRGVSSSVRVPGGTYNTRSGSRMRVLVILIMATGSAVAVAARVICMSA